MAQVRQADRPSHRSRSGKRKISARSMVGASENRKDLVLDAKHGHFIKYTRITAINRMAAMTTKCLSKYARKSERRERSAGIRTSVLCKSFSNRAVVAGRSNMLHHADGRLDKSKLSASAAPALGNAAKRVASVHGSEPQRAKAEIMVSCAPPSLVPISANRKFSSLLSS